MNILCPFCMHEHDESVKFCPNKKHPETGQDLEIPPGYISYVKAGIPVIPMLTIGYRGHGKTCFLSSVFWELRHGNISNQWDSFLSRGLNHETLIRIRKHYIDVLASLKVPERTDEMFTVPLIMRFANIPIEIKSVVGQRQTAHKEFILIFYDIGGEAFNQDTTIAERLPILEKIHTLLFVISLPLLVDQAEEDGSSEIEQMHTLLETIYNALDRFGQRRRKNIVVCFTMADKMWSDPERYGPLAAKSSQAIPSEQEIPAYFVTLQKHSQQIKQHVKEKYAPFHNLLKDFFNNIHFTSLSALGSQPVKYTAEDGTEKERISHGLAPSHVLDPLLLMLQLESGQTGITPPPEPPPKPGIKPPSLHTTHTVEHHIYAYSRQGMATVFSTKGLNSTDVRKLEKNSAYTLPHEILHGSIRSTPTKFVFYGLNEKLFVAGRAFYRGNDDLGRPGNYFFHSIAVPNADLENFHRNPATFVKWLRDQECFSNKEPNKGAFEPAIAYPEHIEEARYSSAGLNPEFVFHLVYYCLHAQSFDKPLLLIGPEETCLNFLEWLYGILPYSVRSTLFFDSYAYKNWEGFHILCLPSEPEYRLDVANSLAFDIENQQHSINFTIDQPEESARLIAEYAMADNIAALQQLYTLEEQMHTGDYAELRRAYHDLSQREREFFVSSRKQKILAHIASQNDSELLDLLQEHITAIDDLKALAASPAMLQKAVEAAQEKSLRLIEEWVASFGDDGVWQRATPEEKTFAKRLHDAVKTLPQPEEDDRALFRTYLLYELRQADELLHQLVNSRLAMLPADAQTRVLNAILRGIQQLSTVDRKEEAVTILIQHAMEDGEFFATLKERLKNARLNAISARITWMFEAAVDDIRAVLFMESALTRGEYDQFKQAYRSAPDQTRAFIIEAHNADVLQAIAEQRDSEFMLETQAALQTSDDIQQLAASPEILDALVKTQEQRLIQLIADWLVNTPDIRGASSLLFESAPLWQAFFRALHANPQRIAGVTVPLQLLQKDYRQDFERVLLEEMFDLLPQMTANPRISAEIFTSLEHLPDSGNEAQQLLRHALAYALSKAPYLLQQMLEHNIFEIEPRYQTFILNAMLEGIADLTADQEREERLTMLFTSALYSKPALFALGRAIESTTLKSISPRISVLTRMARSSNDAGIKQMLALERGILDKNFRSVAAEFSRASREIQDCVFKAHSRAILEHIADQADQELLTVVADKITTTEHVAALAGSPDMLNALLAKEGDRVSTIMLDALFAHEKPDSFYPVLFTNASLWEAFLRQLASRPQRLPLLIEAIRRFPDHYSEPFEDIWLKHMTLRLLPLLKEQNLADDMLMAFDRRFPPAGKMTHISLLRAFVAYELKPTYPGLDDLTDSNIFALSPDIQQVILNSIMRNGIMTLQKDDMNRHLYRLFKHAVEQAADTSLLISAISANKSQLSERRGKILRMILADIRDQFQQIRHSKQLSSLIHSLPERTFWEMLFGV